MDQTDDHLRGILPVLPTPLTPVGEVDAATLVRLADFALAAGVSGLVYPGFASEVSELTAAEREAMLEALAVRVRGRAPIVAGASAESVEEVLVYGRHAQSLGLTHLMIQPPIALGNGLEPVLAFFAAIAEALPDMQIVLQNAPAPRGSDLAPQIIRAIAAAVPQIAYVKEETLPAGPAISHLIANGPETLKGVIGGGGARYILDEYARGACAAMPALEIVDLHVALDAAWREGRRDEARHIYVRTLPLLALQAVYRMQLTKHVLMRRGLLSETGVRAPTPELDGAAIADIDANLEELGLLGSEAGAA